MRIQLERPSDGRAEEFLRAVKRSRKLHRNLATPPDTLEDYTRYVKYSRGPRCANFVSILSDTGELVGVINIDGIVPANFKSAYLGYYAFLPHAGRGLMREGLCKVISHAFRELKLHRLEANIQPINQRSIDLVRSLGFQLEGFSPNYLKISGRWRDHERWAILAPQWRPSAVA